MSFGTTVVEHLLITEKQTPAATGSFTRLLNALIVAAKVIQREVNKAGLVDILGYAGRENVQGEQVRKLDDFANYTMIRHLQRCGEVCMLASEEDADLIEVPRRFKKGNYIVIFDPLDGSSNIDANVSIGTIFSIYRRVSPGGDDGKLEDVLQPGHKQVAAGYIIYGSSTVLVYTVGNGVHGFTLDPSVGEFLVSHENIHIPERGKIFSVNEGNYKYWDDGIKNYIDYLKDPESDHHKSYTSRYIGSLVADFHRNLLYGADVIAALVGKSTAAHVRLTGVMPPVGQFVDEPAELKKTGHLIFGPAFVSHFQDQGRQDRAEVGITAALAQAVYRSLDVDRTGLDSGQCVGHRHLVRYHRKIHRTGRPGLT